MKMDLSLASRHVPLSPYCVDLLDRIGIFLWNRMIWWYTRVNILVSCLAFITEFCRNSHLDLDSCVQSCLFLSEILFPFP